MSQRNFIESVLTQGSRQYWSINIWYK